MQNLAYNLLPQAPATEHFAGGRVKGSMVQAHIDWVRTHRDRGEVIAFFESIPPAMRSVAPSMWVPFQQMIELDRIAVSEFGKGDIAFMQELGAYSARQNLTGVFRLFQRADVHGFFRRSAQLHNRFHDFGSAAYEELSANEGQLIHRGYLSYSPLYCASAIGFYHECIRLHGGTNVAVWESTCQCRGDETCTFELLWS